MLSQHATRLAQEFICDLGFRHWIFRFAPRQIDALFDTPAVKQMELDPASTAHVTHACVSHQANASMQLPYRFVVVRTFDRRNRQ